MQKQTFSTVSRAHHERIGSFAMAVLTLLGGMVVTKVGHNFYKEVMTNPNFAFSQITERENETARIPVRFDNVINTPSTSGF